ncbi:bifunctional diaminohydroxyphosphoribosylaminopyrimidine deaminase/5-amino-6-(5-phosphoribosylamino)uracil reductase RibD [Parapedobacter sp. ISTM3]|uniref:Riboflavin biosynthesis protein RibD n=1 Tax=Parapedobacter luteus TaxID=623280 RepID=A0A1T5F0W8_9SPHI|nr:MULTISPECIES: bifunctional diaminohydroxyphosphoribosylaminopyrimidine deaminase/5-amino-6-(5-phosphoribosylamino)uracil reductase RibD [Parapedobacter]MBK1439273.1 bifunctional diaminohydroxyphosphoribosylaminopyrimidine deaminase/5-amino-6-(5-phosphoribosylamino)uracil reductase RibD [Parapedobacter sp. ISTM3]SKB89803.1 diaminohydroxyphosphoribosylaminopyrimidine deaminase [Parapedobacter luteus]
MQEHERYMRRCLELAQLGIGSVSPNPMVGALLVSQGRIIAENYHRRFGGAHAEALVIEEVLSHYGDQATELLHQATMYVSLEPCAHHGKTPPCARLLAEYRVGRVVIACRDPFEKVNGAGIRILKDAGVDVVEGVLAEEALWLNRRFTTRVVQQRPYIILKWAQTADGYMAPPDGTQRWITGPGAKQLVHRWRSEEDAILVGAKTALVDNPQLTVREWQGKNPRRVLIDKHLAVPEDAKVFDGRAETIVFNAVKSDWAANIKHIELEDFDWYLPQKIAYQLYLMDVQSLIVEGGRKTLDLFIQAGLWDEARVFTSRTAWGSGIAAPVLHAAGAGHQVIGPDKLDVYYRNLHR